MIKKILDIFDDIIQNADTYFNTAIIILQFGTFTGACYHLIRGDLGTAICFVFVTLVLTGLYAD